MKMLPDKEELIKFYKYSASVSGSTILRFLHYMQDKAFFHNLAHISGNIDRIFMRML